MSTVPKEVVTEHFPAYATRQSINRFLALHELFQISKSTKGSIVECGVFMGTSLFSFAHFSAIYEPSNFHREIIGFDTFDGFPSWSDEDRFDESRGVFKPSHDSFSELSAAAMAFQKNHYEEEKKKIHLMKGDAKETIPRFLEENRHFVCSLLFLDFDLYEPTRVALEHFLPRIPRGGVVAFDEVHHPLWPGETEALNQVLGIGNVELRHFNFNPDISYAIL
jgi:hypothetical protein